MKLKNKKVLVTGAGGFIGSHLTEHLVKEGCKVRALVRYKSDGSHGFLDGIPAVKKNVEIVAGDLKDPHAMNQVVKGMDVVFHLGALIAIPYSFQHPNDYVQTNVSGTVNILEAAREYGVQRVLQVSTSEVYGTAQYVPIDESHKRQPQSPYSATKIAADAMAESYHRSFGLPVSIVRPFNTYGPRQSSRAIIPTIIMQAIKGKTIQVGALDPTRDFTFVTDTAKGMCAVAQEDSLLGQDVNLGVGKEISIGEILDLIVELTNFKGKIKTDKSRLRPKKSEVNRLLSDPTKVMAATSWKAKTTLKSGLLKTIRYIENHIDEFDTRRYYR